MIATRSAGVIGVSTYFAALSQRPRLIEGCHAVEIEIEDQQPASAIPRVAGAGTDDGFLRDRRDTAPPAAA